MNPQIPIDALLMEREDRLVDVSELERQVNQILGQPYPFAIPANLPSLQKRKKLKRKAKPRAKAPVRLRPLETDTEAAYRICYIQGNEERIEVHLDAKPLARLLNTPVTNLTVLWIETIRATDEHDWETVETLFEKTHEN